MINLSISFFGKKKYLFIYLFTFVCAGSSVLPGLCSLVADSRGYSLVACTGLSLWRLPLLQGTGFRAQRLQQLCRVSSVVAVPRLRLHDCGTQVYLLHSVWDFPGSGIKPASLALAGRFFFFFFLPLSHQGSPPSLSMLSFQKESLRGYWSWKDIVQMAFGSPLFSVASGLLLESG